MALSGKHRTLSAGLIQDPSRPTQGSPKPIEGLSMPIQDLFEPNNALACQLRALSAKGTLMPVQGLFRYTKGPLMVT